MHYEVEMVLAVNIIFYLLFLVYKMKLLKKQK